jgi:hypothetical protein
MEPRIQYAQTSDGVSISFWTFGEGRRSVHMVYARAAFTEGTSAHVRWEAQELFFPHERGEGECGL